MGRPKSRTKAQKSSVYIVGEGITEQWYFKHLGKLKEYKFKVKPSLFGNTSIDSIKEAVEDNLVGENFVICVFDKDVVEREKSEQKKYESFRNKYKKSKKVIICDSLPSIEFWFILHYLKTNRIFSSKSAEKELQKYINQYKKGRTFLEKPKWVEELIKNQEVAVKRAKEIGQDGESYSNIYKAIEFLDKKKIG